MTKTKVAHLNDSEHLCTAIQPDGRNQRCIRFEDHEGPHQTFVAEWCDGEAVSRRRQVRQARCVNPPRRTESRFPAFSSRTAQAFPTARGY
jgi:hypothetical protein